jgi:hypothetical protein
MFDRSLPLLQERQRELSELLLKSHHLGFQTSQFLGEIRFRRAEGGERTGDASRFPLVFRYAGGLHLRGNERRRGGIQRPRCLERTAMPAGYLLQVFLRHTFDTCIRGVGGQGRMDLLEPVVQGLGMNAKQTSTVCDRKKGHTQNSCARKEQMGDKTRTDFQQLQHIQEISWMSGKCVLSKTKPRAVL